MEKAAEQFTLEDLGDLDITTDDIDFEEVEEELEKFQSDNIIQEALSKGVDLKEYSKQIEQELNYVENLCVQDYLDQASDLASLHRQVKQCDGILERMEDMLSHFKSDLGTISAEIQSLQDKSTAMKTKLKNRLGAQQLLSIVVGAIDIPAEMVKSLTEGEIDEEFSDWLAVLTDRLKYMSDPANRTSVAANELFPIVEKLRLKALARIHEYLLARFHALKKPQTNIQIKQQLLLKLAPLNDFLVSQKEREDVVLEVRNTYIEVMAKIYSSKFKVYLADLKKLQEAATMKKTDVIGAEDTKSTGFFVGGKSSDQMSKLFRMNQRDSVLTDVQSDCIVAHVFSQNNVKLPYERIFRSFHRLLLDTATAEYDFLLNFFAYRRHLPKSQLQPHSSGASMSSTSSTSSTSSSSTTPVAIHMPPSEENGSAAKPSFEAEFADSLAQTQREQSEIREKKEEKESVAEQNVALPTFGHDVKEEDEVMGIPEKDRAKRRAELAIVKNMFAQIFRKTFTLFSSNLEEHLLQCYDPIGIMLMIRVICQHNKIMQAKRIHCLDRFHDGTNMLLWPKFKVVFDANVQSVKDVSYARIKKGSATPHYITSRYADFAAAFLKLNKDYNDAILVAELRRLRVEVEKVFAKCAEKIISPRVVTIFYINTYSIILLAFLPFPESAEVLHFKELQAVKTKVYVEEELSERFGRLIEFLKKPGNPDVETVEQIIKHFARNWKDDVAAVSQSVRTNFADSGDTDIVKQVLVQLVLYYSRFQEIIKKMPSQPPSVQEVLPQSTLMYEIKKYWNQAEK